MTVACFNGTLIFYVFLRVLRGELLFLGSWLDRPVEGRPSDIQGAGDIGRTFPGVDELAGMGNLGGGQRPLAPDPSAARAACIPARVRSWISARSKMGKEEKRGLARVIAPSNVMSRRQVYFRSCQQGTDDARMSGCQIS